MRALATGLCLALPSAGVADGIVIEKSEYAALWPFYADSITLDCRVWENVALVIFIADGRIFPLDQAALGRSWENLYAPLHDGLIDVSQRAGQQTQIDALQELEPLAAQARALCPT